MDGSWPTPNNVPRIDAAIIHNACPINVMMIVTTMKPTRNSGMAFTVWTGLGCSGHGRL